jgi:hypothetical protein
MLGRLCNAPSILTTFVGLPITIFPLRGLPSILPFLPPFAPLPPPLLGRSRLALPPLESFLGGRLFRLAGGDFVPAPPPSPNLALILPLFPPDVLPLLPNAFMKPPPPFPLDPPPPPAVFPLAMLLTLPLLLTPIPTASCGYGKFGGGTPDLGGETGRICWAWKEGWPERRGKVSFEAVENWEEDETFRVPWLEEEEGAWGLEKGAWGGWSSDFWDEAVVVRRREGRGAGGSILSGDPELGVECVSYIEDKIVIEKKHTI